MTCAEFWDLTPRETIQWLQAAALRARDLSRRVVTGAWFTEAFRRQDRLEPLQSTLRQTFGAEPDEKGASLEEYAERAKGFFMRVANREGGRYVVTREVAANG